MKKLLIMLMVVAMAAFLFVGCLGDGVTPPVDDEDEDDVTPPTTVPPVITSVPDAADGYVNAVEALNGIVVNGTAPTLSEVKVYINGICAGTGDVTATGFWTVDVANADLIKAVKVDGAKILYATATDVGLPESDSSNLIEFELDTAAPQITSVRARGGTAAVASAAISYQTFASPAQTIDMFTVALLGAGAQLPLGTTKWKVEIWSIIGITPDIITVRVSNLTAGTFENYEFNDAFVNPVTSSIAWIPGTTTTVNDPSVSGNGLDSTLHIGAYALITTVRTGVTPGRASLTFNEDVSWTQATTGNYTIYNNSLGYDVLTGVPLLWLAPVWLLAPPTFVGFMAYNEAADTMFWTEVAGEESWHLTQGQWLTFQVDTVADVAGNSIPVGSPATANCTILAPTVVIGP